MSRLLCLAIAVTLLAAQPAKEKKPMTDHDRLQGTWQVVSGERAGQPFSADVVKNVRLVFTGDKLVTQNKDRKTESRFTLHPETTPPGIDLEMGKETGLGSYRLNGDDLTIAHGEVGEPRPTGFASTEKVPLTVLVLKRSKVPQL